MAKTEFLKIYHNLKGLYADRLLDPTPGVSKEFALSSKSSDDVAATLDSLFRRTIARRGSMKNNSGVTNEL